MIETPRLRRLVETTRLKKPVGENDILKARLELRKAFSDVEKKLRAPLKTKLHNTKKQNEELFEFSAESARFAYKVCFYSTDIQDAVEAFNLSADAASKIDNIPLRETAVAYVLQQGTKTAGKMIVGGYPNEAVDAYNTLISLVEKFVRARKQRTIGREITTKLDKKLGELADDILHLTTIALLLRKHH